jgi:hypothetical protein
VSTDSTSSFLEVLLAHHQKNYFHSYDEIYVDYNFSPGSSYQATWKIFVEECIPLIGETNLLVEGGVIWLPMWSICLEAVEHTAIKEWFEVKKVSQKENPLFLATSALEEENILHKDLICPPPEEKFLKLKLKKTNHQPRAIGTLHETIRMHHRDPKVITAFEMMRGQSSALPYIIEESNSGPLLEIFQELQMSKKINRIEATVVMVRNGDRTEVSIVKKN